MAREYAIKRLSREAKLELMKRKQEMLLNARVPGNAK